MTYYVAGIAYGNDLYHHGVKGQKWGIRRYQNPDGSLTAAGEKHRDTLTSVEQKRGISKPNNKSKRTESNKSSSSKISKTRKDVKTKVDKMKEDSIRRGKEKSDKYLFYNEKQILGRTIVKNNRNVRMTKALSSIAYSTGNQKLSNIINLVGSVKTLSIAAEGARDTIDYKNYKRSVGK